MNKTNECVKNESIESLLLMAVLGQGAPKDAALRELHRRRAIRKEVDFRDLYMANFSVVAC